MHRKKIVEIFVGPVAAFELIKTRVGFFEGEQRALGILFGVVNRVEPLACANL